MFDQLYDDFPVARFQLTPSQSDADSPFFAPSLTDSVENLTHGPGIHDGVLPAALSSRLQDMTGVNGRGTTSPYSVLVNDSSHNNSPDPSGESPQRTNAEAEDASESDRASSHHAPEHVDCPALHDLSRVPSYSTAVQTPARHLRVPTGNAPPAYRAEEVNRSASPSPNPDGDDRMPTSAMEMMQEAASTHYSFDQWNASSRGSGPSNNDSGNSGFGLLRQHVEPPRNLNADRATLSASLGGRERAAMYRGAEISALARARWRF